MLLINERARHFLNRPAHRSSEELWQQHSARLSPHTGRELLLPHLPGVGKQASALLVSIILTTPLTATPGTLDAGGELCGEQDQFNCMPG